MDTKVWADSLLREMRHPLEFRRLVDPVGAKADELEDLYGPARWFHRLPYRLRKPLSLWSPRERAVFDANLMCLDPLIPLGTIITIPKLGDLNAKT